MTTYRNALAKVFMDAAETGDIVSWDETMSFATPFDAASVMLKLRNNDVQSARLAGDQIIIAMHYETEGLVDEMRCIEYILRDKISMTGHQVRVGLVV